MSTAMSTMVRFARCLGKGWAPDQAARTARAQEKWATKQRRINDALEILARKDAQ